MAENENVVSIDEAKETGRIVELGKPYNFEGTEYTTLDLGGLDKLTIQDAIDAQKQLIGQQEVAAAVLCETTTAFARALAAKATGLPIEFFKLLPRGANRRLGNAVREHLTTEVETEGHYITFEKPYVFTGVDKSGTYTGVDLSGIAELNSMNESEAENRMARAGFAVMENTSNYLYVCILASMGAKLPEEFFTGLPICELLKLKQAVNDADFFE